MQGASGAGAATNSSPGAGSVPHTGNSIGIAGRGGVNNSGTLLVYTVLRKDEASSHHLQPPCMLTCGVQMGSQGASSTLVGKPHTTWECCRLAQLCHAGRSWQTLPALATSGSRELTGYTALLVPRTHSSLCPAARKEKPLGASCALHQPSSQSLKQKRM